MRHIEHVYAGEAAQAEIEADVDEGRPPRFPFVTKPLTEGGAHWLGWGYGTHGWEFYPTPESSQQELMRRVEATYPQPGWAPVPGWIRDAVPDDVTPWWSDDAAPL